MNNTLIDNSTNILSMTSKLKECIAIDDITEIRIATGYWDIPGLALIANELKDFLSKENRKLYLLIGKDPYVYASQVKQPKYKDLNYPQDFIRTDINELEPKEEFEDAVRLLLDFCKDDEDSKIQIRIFRRNEEDETQFLHSKCYVFTGSQNAIGIVGSSNFTEKGLQGNAELNYMETSPMIVNSISTMDNYKSHVQWFEEKWTVAEAWNKEFLEQVLKQAPITKKVEKDKKIEVNNAPFTPYELYIKLLQLQFGDIVDKNLGEQIESYLPSEMHRLNYQIEAVKRCLSIMHEHGGFMLADVVGLGKTIIGTLIIKRFLTVPEDDGRERKVLIITPPAIQSSWKDTIAKFDKDVEDKIHPYIDFITTGRISNLVDDEDDIDDAYDSGDFNEVLEQKNYGLIIIDESHKFRNSGTNMYAALDNLILQIGSETGAFPYIGLLSATPQNNRPDDLKNQIYLFERDRNDSTLKKANGGNLESFFSEINREYQQLIRRSTVQNAADNVNVEISPEERESRLKELSRRIRECVLSDILERRTRTDIKKYYEDDMISQGLTFPEIKGPNNLKYIMDDELAHLFADTMSMIAPTEEEILNSAWHLGYYRYRAIEYFADDNNASKHIGRGNRGVNDVANQLAKIMQILLVKRLESSFAAFSKSLQNLRRYTQNMITMWEKDCIFVCPQIDINKELDTDAKSERYGRLYTFEDCAKDIRNKILKLTKEGKNDKGQNAEYRRSDFREEYIELLKEDYRKISKLYDRWAQNTEDPKFDAFKEALKPELFNKETNTSQKLVIFSEAIDTVDALVRAIKSKGFSPLKITAKNRKDMEDTIKENFDANYEGEWKDDYDVIVTTEVLAEGINLHRANVILNYDTPWNSTRLMQRIGRVNRIGSKEPFIYVYNFMPSAQGDAEIQLVRKAHTKLQSFHVLFGEDSKIFSEQESVMHYALNQAVNGEESPMEKYVYELKEYKEAHPERYKQIEETADGWQMATTEQGDGYFVVKAPRSARLAIRIRTEEDGQKNAQIISLLELLENMQVEEKAKRIPLPESWQQLSADAIKTYNQHFVRINKSRAGDKRTQALEIIVKLYSSNISVKSKNLLKSARKLADKGSFDIIKKMLAIGQELQERESRLFAIEQQDIDEILEREIGKLVAHVESKQGEASIVLGTIK